MIEFQPFPKLARLSRGCVITEKLDGTNAQVIIDRVGEYEAYDIPGSKTVFTEDGAFRIGAGSRTRLITPGKLTDNYGFAAWVWDNANELVKLGLGRHFGEWYGQGIQRVYDLTEKRFALFDVHKWPDMLPRPACVSVVPVLHRGEFSTEEIARAMLNLGRDGSVAVPGFLNPEGIVVYHEQAKVSFKKTFDDGHKEAA
jgi:hypothetical protein